MKKVLVVEDDGALLQILRDKLTKEAFSVFLAKDGAIGLDTALKEHPDLILLDIVMPVMDGMSMLFHLRKDPWGKTVPVILLTNLSEAEDVAESLRERAYDYLVKSDWKLEDVVKKVKEKLEIANIS
jgi:DNA-binding response OmpR family regulator